MISPIQGTILKVAVQEGAEVAENELICIVEAMKVMNEVKSEVKGTIKKMLIESGAAVEFGQPIFLVEPD